MSMIPRPAGPALTPFVLAVALVASPSWAAPAATPSDEGVFARFDAWAGRAMAGAQATSSLEEGVDLARRRRGALADLVRANPRRALELALPASVRERLPEAVRPYLETTLAGVGALDVVALCDFVPSTDPRRTHYEHALTLEGRTYRAHLYGRRLGLTTRTIPVFGVAVGDDVALHERPVVPLSPEDLAARPSLLGGCAACVAAHVGPRVVVFRDARSLEELEARLVRTEEAVGPGVGASPGLGPLSERTEGEKEVLYIRVDFSDLEGEPVSEAAAQKTLDEDTDQFFQDGSYQKTSLVGTLTPVLRMPQTAAWYKANGDSRLLTDARAAALAAGFDTAGYDLDIVAFKKIFDGYSGKARVGGKGIWLNGSFGVGVTSHELGHNYGVRHANFWQTTDGSVIGAGSSEEYGNIFDVMGRGGAPRGHFNSWFKSRFDWLTPEDVTSVTASGTYRIQALDDPGSDGIRGLRIVKDAARNYWVEFRQRFTSNRWAMNGAVLEWGYNTNRQSDLLDTTPGSPNGKNDSPIVIGRTFSDLDAGVHITPIAKGGTSPESLDVVVNLGAFEGNDPPVVSVSASATTVPRNSPVTLTAAAADENGDPLAYHWDLGDATVAPSSPTVSKSWSASGTYVVSCTVSDMVGGTAAGSVSVTVTASNTFTVSGTVTLHGQPLADVTVSDGTRTARSDASGLYRILGVPSGTYTLTPSREGHTFTPPTRSVTVSGSNRSGLDFVATALPPPASVIFHATFDAGADGFTYADDAFRGTAQPGYASGAHSPTGGFTGGGLTVGLGGVDDADITGMSGGWWRSFVLDAPARVSVTFRLRLTQAADYESDEFSEGLLSLDGVLVGGGAGDALVRLAGNGNGGSPRTSGFQLFQVDLGTLAAGTHTLALGGYNNQKTLANESTEVVVDEVILAAVPPVGTVVFHATFDAGADGFTYADDAFRGTAQPGYASGAFSASGGFSGGALTVALGGVDDADVTGMSGGWQRSFDLVAPAAVSVAFRLRLTQAADYESDEFSEGLLAVDGVLVGTGAPLVRLTGNGNGGSPQTTGFQLFQLDLGTLSAGTHTLTLGGYNNQKTLANEATEVVVDEVILSRN